MDGKKTKMLGIAVIIAAFLLGSINSIMATNPSITDTDPSTYIIVVMLMLFFLIAASAKEDLKFEFNKKSMLYGTAIFLIYILLLSYSRVGLSTTFQSYRIDALLFVVLLASLITLVFGLGGMRKMKQVLIYALFASPILLLPILSLNGAFAGLNAELVYEVIRTVGVPVVKSGLVISAPSLSSITISTTCASIGTFIALVMFLVPVAYLYEGKLKAKALWVSSGLGLMLVFNVVRMSSISLVWAYYGIGRAISLFHAFAGQLLFYAAIIIMLLIAGRYGMKIGEGKKKTGRRGGGKLDRRLVIPSAIAIVFGLVVFALSMQYSSAVYAPAMFFGNTSISGQLTYRNMVQSLEPAHANITELGGNFMGVLFAITQDKNSTNNVTYVIATQLASDYRGGVLANYSAISNTSAYTLRNGVTINSGVILSGGQNFYVNYSAMPYNYSGEYATINYMMFKRMTNSSTSMCQINDYVHLGLAGYVESVIYNAMRLQFSRGNGALECYSYYIAGQKYPLVA